MVSNGLTEEQIREKWDGGTIIRIEHLREHNYYNGVDHGRDYTGLANYLFRPLDTGERTRHHYKGTRNLCQPEKEAATEAKQEYSRASRRERRRLQACRSKTNRYGYMCFKYVRNEDAAEAPPPNNRNGL